MSYNFADIFPESIFFVSPDVKRGMGLEDVLPHYHIVCTYFDPLIPILRRQGARIFCLEEVDPRKSLETNNTGKLLENPVVLDYIRKNSSGKPNIAFFKPSVKIDLILQKYGWSAIGNSASLNEQFENKVTFYKSVMQLMPEYALATVFGKLGEMNYEELSKQLDKKMVIQFGHGWAGKTTYFINNNQDFLTVAGKFPQTLVKISKQISDCFTVLNNCCLYDHRIFVSPPAIQISNIPELYPKAGVTCGRQWPVKFLDQKQIAQILWISQEVGRWMDKDGFGGFFGLDFLVEKASGRIYLSENNARLTASSPLYTRLEKGLGRMPLFVYHLASFFGKTIPVDADLSDQVIGSQITIRQTSGEPLVSKLEDYGVYQIQKGKPVLLRRDYIPEKLKEDEFIFMKRFKKETESTDEETGRIETKREVLADITKVQPWLSNLLAK
ncbi:hypothetical protein MUP32_02020 [Candidatus Microgenomates bacterium]|nr:hypothetical protein [Candidatus Microgenomates bacterium]